jgi:hypothetical protein
MPTAERKAENGNGEAAGVVYETVCQNPGCGHAFELRITPQNAGLLSGTMPCPRCRRHGGMLKPTGRLGNKRYAAKLMFRATNVTFTPPSDEEDLVSEMRGASYQ